MIIISNHVGVHSVACSLKRWILCFSKFWDILERRKDALAFALVRDFVYLLACLFVVVDPGNLGIDKIYNMADFM